MVEFLNIFVVPLISVEVYARRFNKPLVFDYVNLVIYGCFTVMDFIAEFFVMKALEGLWGIGGLPSSQFYTIIAVATAFLLPYIYEIYRKYVSIRCEIKGKQKKSNN